MKNALAIAILILAAAHAGAYTTQTLKNQIYKEVMIDSDLDGTSVTLNEQFDNQPLLENLTSNTLFVDELVSVYYFLDELTSSETFVELLATNDYFTTTLARTQTFIDEIQSIIAFTRVETMATSGSAGTAPVSDGAEGLVMTDIATQAELDAAIAAIDIATWTASGGTTGALVANPSGIPTVADYDTLAASGVIIGVTGTTWKVAFYGIRDVLVDDATVAIGAPLYLDDNGYATADLADYPDILQRIGTALETSSTTGTISAFIKIEESMD